MYVCFKAGNFTRFLSNSVRKEKKPFIFPLFPKPFLDLSRGGRYLGGGRKEREKKKDGKKRSVQKRTPIVRYHRFDEKFLFVIGGISPVYRYFTASPYYK